MIQIAPHLIRPERNERTRARSDSDYEFEEYNEMMDFEEKEEAVEHMLTSESPPEGGLDRISYMHDLPEDPPESKDSCVLGCERPDDRGESALEDDNVVGEFGETKTVRFGSSSAPVQTTTQFPKEAVEVLPSFSLMTKTLAARGLLSQANFNEASDEGRSVPIKVFIAVGQRPVTVKVKDTDTVAELIQLVVEQCQKDNNPLPHEAAAYELRMLDDDDGTPDEDIAALDMMRQVHTYGASALALTMKEGWTPDPARARGKSTRGNQVKLNSSSSRAFIRVFLGDSKQSYVLKTTPEMTLQDCIPLIAKKKQVDPSQIPVEMHNFIYYGDDTATATIVPMSTTINTLASDTVQFIRKVPATKGITIEATSHANNNHHSFSFDIESAGAYSEYRVIKTNRRGKDQQRILGIDRHNIHNKVSGVNAKKLFGIKTDGLVGHPLRPVSSILKCDLDPMPHPNEEGLYFVLTVKDNGKEKELLYKGQTKIDVAEIIAKISFLRDWYRERANVT
eukprot:g65338.t1